MGRRTIWRYGIMREAIREIILEMFDTNATIKTGGIDLAVGRIETLYKKKYESIDEYLQKVEEQKFRLAAMSIMNVDLTKKAC